MYAEKQITIAIKQSGYISKRSGNVSSNEISKFLCHIL